MTNKKKIFTIVKKIIQDISRPLLDSPWLHPAHCCNSSCRGYEVKVGLLLVIKSLEKIKEFGNLPILERKTFKHLNQSGSVPKRYLDSSIFHEYSKIIS